MFLKKTSFFIFLKSKSVENKGKIQKSKSKKLKNLKSQKNFFDIFFEKVLTIKFADDIL